MTIYKFDVFFVVYCAVRDYNNDLKEEFKSGRLPGQQLTQIRMRWWRLQHERQKLGRIQQLARDDIHLLCSLLNIGP